MKTLLLSAPFVVALLVVGPLLNSVAAQQTTGANASRFGVAVVDISYIFKHVFQNLPRFKGQMDALQAEVKAVEDKLQAGRLQIAQSEERLKTFKPGSTEFKELDEKVSRDKAIFNLDTTKQRKDFMERESKIYHQTYVEVSVAIKYYSERNNIGLVLRFNGDPGDDLQRENVMRQLSKPVVFQNGIDITGEILRMLTQGGQPAVQGAASNPVRGQTAPR